MLYKGIDLESIKALAEALSANTHVRKVTCGMSLCPRLCESVDWSERNLTADGAQVLSWPIAFDISGTHKLNFRSHAVSCALSETGTVREGEGYYRVMEEPIALLRAALPTSNVISCRVWNHDPIQLSQDGEDNPRYQHASEEPARQKELDELCNLNRQRLEFYRPHQRLLLRALHERPLTTAGATTNRPLVGLDLPFSAALFELVCGQLEKCVVAPASAPDSLPEFLWGCVGYAHQSCSTAQSDRGQKRAWHLM
jgi:hypothetical protein